MENRIVRKAIETETELLAKIIKANPGCYLEVDKRDGNQWRFLKEKPDWDAILEDKDGESGDEVYLEGITLASSNEFDFPGISAVGVIDPVLYEAMAIALGVTLAPEGS